MEVRQRKLLEQSDVLSHQYTTTSRTSRCKPVYWKRKFMLLVIFGLLSTLVLGTYYDVLPWKMSEHATNAFDNVALILGLQKHTHAVIIDAGSTGSRVLAFSFHQPVFGDKTLKLDKEVFAQVKPGLSSFADDPKKGAESLRELLQVAEAAIPPQDRSRTPLAIKATAGLRLLPERKANALLQEVRHLLASCAFYTNERSVDIMDGVDEGLFSWFTVNFLQDRLGGPGLRTAAALDLGGGSTQVTFAPVHQSTLRSAGPKLLHPVLAFHQNLTVYTRSFLGLGLMAARKEVLTAHLEPESTEAHSPCINPIVSTTWTYGGVTYTVKGPLKPVYQEVKASGSRVGEKRPVVQFNDCVKIIKEYVKRKADVPKELNEKEINAFSYYFDRASEFGLIDPFVGGEVKVKQFQEAAVAACNTPNVDQPFMCLDLAFISVLLQEGFGLSPDTSLSLLNQIDGHEVSWALGAAFHILQNGL